MRQGMEMILRLPENIKEQIINNHVSLEEFYFEIFYNRHQHLLASKSKNEERIKILDNDLLDYATELEKLGVIDGTGLTFAITSDFTEGVASNFVSTVLGKVGASEDDVRDFIAKYVN